MSSWIKRLTRELASRTGWGMKLWFSAQRFKDNVASVLLSDEKYVKWKHLARTGEDLDLDDPRRFNEKLWWLNLNNRDPKMTLCADKYRVREYVARCGLGHILNEVYAVYDSADEIDLELLPSPAFIKTNHGSGMNLLFDRDKPFDAERFRISFNAALARNYYGRSREWCYKNIEPKIIVEKVLVQQPFLVDYKFMCFDGKVKMVLVDIEVAAADGTHNPWARRNIYDPDFRRLDVKVGREHFEDGLVSRPEGFNDMIKYAEILSSPFPHCRVDLYNIDGKIYFGELTFCHGGGSQQISPRQWDEKMGSWIDLKSDKIVLSDGG